MDDHQEERETVGDRRTWHFEKRIGLGEVIQLAVVLFAVFGAAYSILKEVRDSNTATVLEMRSANAAMDKRVSIIEKVQEMQKQVDMAQDALTRDGQQRIEGVLTDIQKYLREQRAKP